MDTRLLSTTWALALASLLLAHPLLAADGTWTYDGDDAWSNTARWASGTVANGADSTAHFHGLNISATRTVTNDAPRTIGHMKFGDTSGSWQSWVLTGSNITLDTSSGMPVIQTAADGVNSGTVDLQVDLLGNDGLIYTGLMARVRGNNTYSGGTLVAGGELRPDHVNAFGTGAVTLRSGALCYYQSLTFPNAVVLDGDFTLGYDGSGCPGNSAFAGAATLTGNRTFTLRGYSTTFTDLGDGGNGYGLTITRASTASGYSAVVGLAGTSTYTGPTVINATFNGAVLRIYGTLDSTASITINPSGQLDAYMGTNDRVGDAIPIIMRSGKLSASGYQGSPSYTKYETFGSTTVPVIIHPGMTTFGTTDMRGYTTLTIGAFIRDNSTILFDRNVSVSGAGKILLPAYETRPGLIGPWAIAINTGTVGSDLNRYDFATYDPFNGVEVLSAAGRPADVDSATVADNMYVSSDPDQALTASRTNNSLVISCTTNISLTANSPSILTIQSGGIIVRDQRGNAANPTTSFDRNPLDFRIAGDGSIRPDAGELVIHTVGTHSYQTGGSTWFTMYSQLTIDATVADGPNGATTLLKSGNGKLILGGTNTFSGDICVANGMLTLTNRNLTAGAVTVAASATLDLQHTNALGRDCTLELQHYGEYYGVANVASNVTVSCLRTNSQIMAAGNYTSGSLPNFITGSGTLTVLTSLDISNGSASNVASTSATLTGALTSTGGLPTAVYVFWGSQDGGTDASAWSHTNSLGSLPEGPITADISGLSGETTYYYRFCATNAAGVCWAAPSASFQTLPNRMDYPYRMKITFSGYTRDEPLTNFPALVILGTNRTGFLYSRFKSDTGGDLRFLDSNETAFLDHEIENWDTNGLSQVWVRLPVLASSNDFIWAYWGGSAHTEPPACTTNGTVWDTGYRGVWHMNQTNAQDSTMYHNHGTAAGGVATLANGSIGPANTFDGSSGRIAVSDSASLSFTGAALTFEAWARVPALPTVERPIARKEDQWSLEFYDQNTIRNLVKTSSTSGWTTGNDADYSLQANTWYYWTLAYNGANVRHYIDASPVAFNAGSGACSGSIVDNGNPLYFSYMTYNSTYLGSDLDEIRISSVARSTNWLWASYMTAASNTPFVSYGLIVDRNPTVFVWR